MTTEIAVVSQTVSLPVPVEEAIRQWAEYQDLTRRLLDANDYQQIGRTRFKKKSAWRKYARAFNITDCVTYEEIVRADDGFPIFARIRVKATASNGRTAEADHECHVIERCCPARTGEACPKKTWKGHYCCKRDCNGRVHFSHPGDLPATALTRAKNRAISDLIGAGEVSAEEMQGQRSIETEEEQEGPPAASKPQYPKPFVPPTTPPIQQYVEGVVVDRSEATNGNGHAAPATPTNGEHMTDAQQRMIFALGKGKGWKEEEIKKQVQDYQQKPLADLTKFEATKVIDWLRGVGANA